MLDLDIDLKKYEKPQSEVSSKYIGSYIGTKKSSNQKYKKNDFKKPKPKAPVLKTSESGWKSSRLRSFGDMDRNQEVIKDVRDLLNKLTFESFEKISNKIETNIDNIKILHGVVDVVFEKAIGENFFCPLYAKLCERISNKFPSFTYEDENGIQKEETFKRYLLNTCQKVFEREQADPPEGLNPTEMEDFRVLSKRRLLGKIYLIFLFIFIF